MDATLLPYWENKALATPTLTLPDSLLIISFIFVKKINAFLMWSEIWKGRKKKFAKRQIRTCVDRVKRRRYTPYHLRHWNWQLLDVLCNVVYPESHIGGRSWCKYTLRVTY